MMAAPGTESTEGVHKLIAPTLPASLVPFQPFEAPGARRRRSWATAVGPSGFVIVLGGLWNCSTGESRHTVPV